MPDPRPDEPSLPPPWGEHSLPDDGERSIDVGPLRLRVRRADSEIWLARAAGEGTGDAATIPEIRAPAREPERTRGRGKAAGRGSAPERPPGSGGAGGPVDGDGEETEWSRWAVPSDGETIRLLPAFPDRPVVVEPERPFHLTRGSRVRVYVRVPLHVRIQTGGPAPVTFARIPTVTLSDTWFGDFQEGELCYFLPTTARREILHEHFAPHLAACPLRLANGAEEDLKVEKLALRVAHLSLFARDEELWADESVVRYRGAELGSDLRTSGEAPPEVPEARRVAAPEVPAEKGLRARTFARIAQFPGFGTGG